MKKIIFSAMTVFAVNIAFAQCPVIRVNASADEYKEGEQVQMTAYTDAKTDVTYNWSVSAGSISSGQGTSSITIDSKGLADQSVTATVDLGGISRDCSSSGSATVIIIKAPKPVKKKAVRKPGKKG